MAWSSSDEGNSWGRMAKGIHYPVTPAPSISATETSLKPHLEENRRRGEDHALTGAEFAELDRPGGRWSVPEIRLLYNFPVVAERVPAIFAAASALPGRCRPATLARTSLSLTFVLEKDSHVSCRFPLHGWRPGPALPRAAQSSWSTR